MNKKNEKLKLNENNWYAWEMIPGYVGKYNIPYYSPIYIEEIRPLGSGKNILEIDFINIMYAEGVQNFTKKLRILKHEENYLCAETLHHDEASDRVVIISKIELSWIKEHCPNLCESKPPKDFLNFGTKGAQEYLNQIYRINR